MFYYSKNSKFIKQYFDKVTKNDFINKELLLKTLLENSLTLRMTRYVYEPEFKYHAIFRIRNNFKLNTIGYFD